KMPYAMPVGYFDQLQENLAGVMNQQSAKEEIASLSPLLSGLNKQMPYSIPAGYFDTLAASQNTKPVTKVVSITCRRWFRLAAAAVVTGIVVLAGFRLFGNDHGTVTDPGSKVIAKFSSEVKNMNDDQKDKLIDLVNGGLSNTEVATTNPVRPNDVKQLLEG